MKDNLQERPVREKPRHDAPNKKKNKTNVTTHQLNVLQQTIRVGFL